MPESLANIRHRVQGTASSDIEILAKYRCCYRPAGAAGGLVYRVVLVYITNFCRHAMPVKAVCSCSAGLPNFIPYIAVVPTDISILDV